MVIHKNNTLTSNSKWIGCEEQNGAYETLFRSDWNELLNVGIKCALSGPALAMSCVRCECAKSLCVKIVRLREPSADIDLQ
jgi:hypothetical protein